MASVTLTAVTKRFGRHTAVDAVTLGIADGEFVALLGPSGCGKTTLLRLIAGFERVDGGRIAFDGRTVSDGRTHEPPERRRIGMVFQSYALWPHMTVAGNVGYPLQMRRMPADDRRRRVASALETVGLSGFGNRRPAELSGGQRQRVALARCLVTDPALVLLDEPLANLDIHLREAMEGEFRTFHRATGATMVYVTHDQAEAMALADRVAVMRDGRIEQVAPPRQLYHEPATPMVAEFVGRGLVVPATVQGGNGNGRVGADIWGSPVILRAGDANPGARQACLRAEGLSLTANGGIAGRVRHAVYQGATTLIAVHPDAEPSAVLRLRVPGEPPAMGESVRVAVNDGWVLPTAG